MNQDSSAVVIRCFININLNLALEVRDASAFKLYAIAQQATNDLSAAARGLKRAKRILAQWGSRASRPH